MERQVQRLGFQVNSLDGGTERSSFLTDRDFLVVPLFHYKYPCQLVSCIQRPYHFSSAHPLLIHPVNNYHDTNKRDRKKLRRHR